MGVNERGVVLLAHNDSRIEGIENTTVVEEVYVPGNFLQGQLVAQEQEEVGSEPSLWG